MDLVTLIKIKKQLRSLESRMGQVGSIFACPERLTKQVNVEDATASGKNVTINFDIKVHVNTEDILATITKRAKEGLFNKECYDADTRENRKASEPSELAQSKDKNVKIPYVTGKPGDYVLVKFNKEKRRETTSIKPAALRLFGDLLVVLRRILWDERATESELSALSEDHRKIFEAILRKKRLVKPHEEVEYTPEALKRVSEKEGQKRNEENLKCIFKYTQKFLRSHFRKNNENFRFRTCDSTLKQKNLIDLGFYMFYFGRIADKNDWPIVKFFHPKVFSKDKKGAKKDEMQKEGIQLGETELRPKTINKEYIDNLRRSRDFMQDMSLFLNNRFPVNGDKITGIIEQYKAISEEKIFQKLNQWQLMLEGKKKGKNKDKSGMERILMDLTKNDKCKLPWSIREIIRAVNDTKTHFQIQDTRERLPGAE